MHKCMHTYTLCTYSYTECLCFLIILLLAVLLERGPTMVTQENELNKQAHEQSMPFRYLSLCEISALKNAAG